MSAVLVIEMLGGKTYRVEVPDDYSIESATSSRGLLSVPGGTSFLSSEIKSAVVEREGEAA